MDFLRKRDLSPARAALLALPVVFFILFLIYPLAYVFIHSMFVRSPGSGRRFTLAFYRMFFFDPGQYRTVVNSSLIAITVTVITTLLSVPLAFMMIRYEFKGKGSLNGLLLLPMVLPPFVGAIAVSRMFSTYGAVNALLIKMGLLEHGVDWFAGGFWGVVILEVLHLYPIMYLNVAAALANVDPSLEEAARNSGASGWTLFRKITFPLALPGYFAGSSIVFIWAFTDLGTPLVFNYRQVVPVQIFDRLSAIDDPAGYVLVVFLVIMTAVVFMLSKWLVGAKRYEMLGRGHVASITRPAGKAATAFIHLFAGLLILAAVIPHIGVILTAFSDTWFMTVLPEKFTTTHITEVFTLKLTRTSIINSLLLSFTAAGVDVALGILIAWFLSRTKIPGRGVLDALSMMPLAVPGIILAFGYIGAFSGTFLDPMENPFPLLILAYAVRRLPYMVRSAYAGFQQTSVSLEEAARNAGAGPFRTTRKITVPLMAANIAAGAVLCFAFAMLEVSDSLVLATQQKHYPITKAIYHLLGRLSDGNEIACAMGVLGMILLGTSLFLAGSFLGRRMGELFRTH